MTGQTVGACRVDHARIDLGRWERNVNRRGVSTTVLIRLRPRKRVVDATSRLARQKPWFSRSPSRPLSTERQAYMLPFATILGGRRRAQFR